MNTRKWQNIYNWGSDEYLDTRHIGGRAYQSVEILDMNAYCGRDNEGQPKYCVELSLVDLDVIPASNVESAIASCGWDDDMEADDLQIAEACRSYGAKAPLFSDSGNNWRKLLADARREANELASPRKLTAAMNRPVNKLGSTAAEYMRGDLDSAMTRGVLAGDQGARICAKMYGIDQVTIDDARPADWLPYVAGYMSAMSGGERETGNDLAPEYNLGYARGERVAKGEAPAPGWIKQRS